MTVVVRLARGDLAGLDTLTVDALVLPWFALAKPPTAVSGYADWRLSGRLGRLLLENRFSGSLGETLLMPSLGRIGAARLFLFGLGAPSALTSQTLVEIAGRMVRVLVEAGVRSLALAAPSGDPTAERTSVALLERWLEAAARSNAPFSEVVLLDGDGTLEAARVTLEAAASSRGLSFART